MKKHIWKKINPVQKEARMSKQCSCCGVKKYNFYDDIRFLYPDGRLHSSRTVDEPECLG